MCKERGHFDITVAAASILSEQQWDSHPKSLLRELVSASLSVADHECGLPTKFDLYVSLDDGQNDYCAARSRNVSLDNAAQQLADEVVAHQRLMDTKSLLPPGTNHTNY